MRWAGSYRYKCLRSKKRYGPKKARSAFLYFSSDRTPALKEEQPSLSPLDLSRVLGEEWERLTEAEKKPYIELSTNDRSRYEVERQRYY